MRRCFLVDEMFRQRGNTLRIHIGEPITHTLLNQDKQEWASNIRKSVYDLPSMAEAETV